MSKGSNRDKPKTQVVAFLRSYSHCELADLAPVNVPALLEAYTEILENSSLSDRISEQNRYLVFQVKHMIAENEQERKQAEDWALLGTEIFVMRHNEDWKHSDRWS